MNGQHPALLSPPLKHLQQLRNPQSQTPNRNQFRAVLLPRLKKVRIFVTLDFNSLKFLKLKESGFLWTLNSAYSTQRKDQVVEGEINKSLNLLKKGIKKKNLL
jgi:hypothetical protein